jgi:hypothetical protein
MKKTALILVLFSVLAFTSSAQVSLGTDIIGTWKVVGGKVQTPKAPKGQEKQLEAYKQMFLHSTFVFKADYNFHLDIGIDELKIQKGHWKYNAASNTYQIQEWADKDKNNSFLMEIVVKKEGDKIYFILPTDELLPEKFKFEFLMTKI